MKIEVTPAEAAAVYVGKAVALLDIACTVMGELCNGCPMNVNHLCIKGEFKSRLLDK